MKKLVTKDGYIELDNKEITTLFGETAHEVYFNLLRLFRKTLNFIFTPLLFLKTF